MGLGPSGLVDEVPEPTSPDPIPQAPSPKPQAPTDEPDELPAVGRVWEGGGATSIFNAFKKNQGTPPPKPTAPPWEQQPTPQQSDNLAPVDPTNFDALMQRFHNAAFEQAPTIAGFLEGGRIIDVNAGTVTLEYPKNFEASARMLDRNGKRESLQEVLSALLGKPTGIKFSISDQELIIEKPKPEKPAAPQWEKRSPTPAPEPVPVNQGIPVTEELRVELMQNNPLIKSIAETFGARVVKVE